MSKVTCEREHQSRDPFMGLLAIALGAIATIGQLTLVWGFEYFPSIDGPAHTHLAHAYYEALRGDGFYNSLIHLNPEFNPNLATQSVLIALMSLAAPPTAEKIWLSLYFLSFTIASAYSLSRINKKSLALLPLLVFCSISFPLAFGFYNFSFSSVILIAWLGYWWRHRNDPRLRVIAGHAGFALFAFTTHIFAFIVSLLAIGIAALSAILLSPRNDKTTPDLDRDWWKRTSSHLTPPILGSIPELVACLYFLFIRFGQKTTKGASNLAPPDPDRLKDLLMARSFAPYDSIEMVATMIFVAAILLLLVYFVRRGGNLRASIPFGLILAGFLLIYLLLPQQWLVRWMPQRFQPLVFITFLLWLASLVPAGLKRSQLLVIGLSALLVLAGSLVLRLGIFMRIDGYYRELMTLAPHIAQNTSLITLRLHNTYQGRPFPADLDIFIQAGSRLADASSSIDLKNFQGQSKDHPIQFLPGISATAPLGGDRALVSLPPRVELMAYEQLTGRQIDYIVTYGFRNESNNISALSRLDHQLRDNYRLIYISEPLGFARLYERNSIDPTLRVQ